MLFRSGEKADEGYFLGYMPGSPNKRVFNTTAGKIDIAYNIEVTSYTHAKQTEPDWLYNYEVVFNLFNVPFLDAAGTSGVDHVVLHDEENETCTPRSSIPTTLNIVPATHAGPSSSAETPT